MCTVRSVYLTSYLYGGGGSSRNYEQKIGIKKKKDYCQKKY